MINCIIVDDEQHALDSLTNLVQQTPFLKLAGVFLKPVDALTQLPELSVQLVFLDMHMPGLSGIEFMKLAMGKVRFILCTAHSQYALESFDYHVIDYLLKPIEYPRFLMAAQKAKDVLETTSFTEAEKDHFFVRTDSKNLFVKIDFAHILYIEALKNYACIYTQSEKILTRYTLKSIQSVLPPNKFMRIHNSFIVPLTNIKLIDKNEVELKHATIRLPVGESYHDNLYQALNIPR
jgi:DNA-binding LytR/AlgR family response regulator